MPYLFQLISNGLAPLVVAGAVMAYIHPPLFLIFQDWFLWLFAATMFAVGLVLRPEEIGQTLRRPKALLVGVLTQFTVMPLLGFTVAMAGGLDRDLALGMILVGCAPGAMASNVIVFLAGGAAAYSVALTISSSLLSPIVTPSLVEVLGGIFVPIPFWPMVRTIVLTVLIPLVLGVIARRVVSDRGKFLFELAPPLAVVSIVIIVSYGVAQNREILGETGLRLFCLVVTVNFLGYLLGWCVGKLFRLEARFRLALAVEVGMQNAGLGVALALRHFSAETALPGVMYAVWCIISAALLIWLLRFRFWS